MAPDNELAKRDNKKADYGSQATKIIFGLIFHIPSGER